MPGYVKWSDIRAELVELAGGEEVVAAGKARLLAECAAWEREHGRTADAGASPEQEPDLDG